ncbi:MAG TPA: NADP-dependent malic enzyme [Aeromicrobium sp.]|jgi:malate dehydrogenase (oxaloacetate-decarboxylating)|nr:NADP-dependent malic enzyme [Aeromicrobium sp.]
MVATDIDARPDLPDPGDDPVFALHRGGKMEVAATVPLRDADDLSLSYTPGVARVCEAIFADPELAHEYTWVSNTVAVVTDGTAVLGLGNIGPAASMPVMEGKAILFKQFGGVDAIPVALNTTDVDEIVETVTRLAPTFGGINLEDIASPRCFEIERRLIEALDIPVFHDDQHGTAVVVLAGLLNAARVTDRDLEDCKVVISGAGAAGVAITKILMSAGVRKISVIDRQGVVHPSRDNLNEVKQWLATKTAEWAKPGSVADALVGADVFIGVSGGTIPEEAVAQMADDAIVFALANPHPEVHPDIAAKYARVVATGRSDFPNQLNNVLVFPGIFRGALDVRATGISESMKLAAANAIADLIEPDELTESYIIPSPFDPRVATAVARAVTDTARREGLARRPY